MGRLELIIGCMFAGKTERLRDFVHRERFRFEHTDERPTVPLFKPAMDTRYGQPTNIISHNQTKTPCIPVPSAQDIFAYVLEHPSVCTIGVDEIQFFDEAILDLCLFLTQEKRISVVASGLNTDFRGNPFCFKDSQRTMGDLMNHAHKIHSVAAWCAYRDPETQRRCTEEAHYTQRLFSNGDPVPYADPLIFVGGKETLSERRYEARCRNHHFVPGDHQQLLNRPLLFSFYAPNSSRQF